jgi:hypothetical protein
MPLPTTGPLSINDIRTQLSSSSGSLRTLSGLAGFSSPDSISEFRGYPTCSNIVLDDVVYLSGNTYQLVWSTGTDCTAVTKQWSRNGSTWTSSTAGCTSPGNVDVGDKTGTWYFRLIKNCTGGATVTSNVITYVYGVDVRVWGRLTSFYAGFRLYARYGFDGMVYDSADVVVSTSDNYVDLLNVPLGSVVEVNICDSTQFYFTKLGVSTLYWTTPTFCSYIFTEVPINFTTTNNIYVQGDPSLICNAGM